MNKRIAVIVLVVLCVCAVAHALYYYPLLPEKVPSNFNMQGQAHGWTQKTSFMIVYLVTVAGLALCFPGVGWLISRTPPSKMNIPNRDYWMAPERRGTTVDYLICSLTWMGSATILFVIIMFHSCFEAGISKSSDNASITGALVAGGLYGAVVLAFCVAPFVRFRKPRTGS